MNSLSIALTVAALVAHSLGHPHREHGGSSDFQSGGHFEGDRELRGGYGPGQGGGVGLGQGGLGRGQGGLGHGQGGLGHGSDIGGGSHNQQQYERDSHGGGSNLNVVSGFSKTRVEAAGSHSSGVGGGSSSGHLQNGGRGIGSSGLGGGSLGGSGFESGNSQFGSQSSGHKGLIVEESSGFTSVNKNQGGYRDNERGSSVGSSGGRASRY